MNLKTSWTNSLVSSARFESHVLSAKQLAQSLFPVSQQPKSVLAPLKWLTPTTLLPAASYQVCKTLHDAALDETGASLDTEGPPEITETETVLLQDLIILESSDDDDANGDNAIVDIHKEVDAIELIWAIPVSLAIYLISGFLLHMQNNIGYDCDFLTDFTGPLKRCT